jgi:peptidase C25-like protein
MGFMFFSNSGLQKNWQLFLLTLVAITLVAFFANVPLVEAQSSARLRLIQSDTSRIVLELEVSGYDSRDVTVGGATYALLSIGDLGRTGEPGKPQLLVKGAMIGIPPGAQLTLRIVEDQSQTVTLPRHPLPAPTITAQQDPRQTLPGPPSQSFTPNAATYSANQYYPSAASKIGATGDWRSQHYATVQFYPLQYNPVTHQLILHRRLRVEITLSYSRGQSPATLGTFQNEGAFESVFEGALLNYASAKNWRTQRSAAPAPRRAAAPTLSGDWYKIGVNANGIYKVTCGQLATAKGVTLTIAPSTIQLFNLQVFTSPVEYAINVVGAGWNNGTCGTNDQSDYIEFFGLAPTSIYTNTQAPFNKYTNTNIYWLTYSSNTGKRMATRDGTPGIGTLATSYTETLHLEQNIIYRPFSPRMEDFEHWYWDFFYSPTPSKTYTFQLDHATSNGFSPTLQIDLVGAIYGGGAPPGHHTEIDLNSCTSLDNTSWSGYVERQFTITLPPCLNLVGTNTITVTEIIDYLNDLIYTNYFNIGYQRTYNAITNTIGFSQSLSNTWQYSITGFTDSNLQTFDITDPYNVAQISAPAPVGGPPYTLQFSDTVTTTALNYVALSTAQLMTPTSLVKYAPFNPDLRSTGNHADYIIISATSFKTLTATNQLKTLRNGQFPNGATIVDVQDIYDQFNNGLVDPKALRDFLACAYGSPAASCAGWLQSSPPQFVLLVGAGTFDPKGYCLPLAVCSQVQTPANSTLIAPYLRMVDPDPQSGFGETDSDNCLVSFAAPCSLITHTIPYMSVGRLPADTSEDVTALVNKILTYENPGSGPWRSTGTFVADNPYDASGNPDPGSPGGEFWTASEAIAGNKFYFPSGLMAERTYYNPCTNTISYPWCSLPFPSYSTDSAAHSAILSAINSGRVIVNYIGHGGIETWADENLFSGPVFSSDLASLTNGNKTPVMLELTCRTGYFIYPHPDNQSLAKLNVNLSNNGAVASWAAVGAGVVTGHDALEKGFFNAVMNQNTRQLGPATTAGKANLYATGFNLDLIDTIVLLGDPASRLAIQFSYNLPLIMK